MPDLETATQLRATRVVAATAPAIYDLVADLTQMGRWSPENQGGDWIDGASGPAVGARFKGRNKRKWGWTTAVVVTEADRGQSFAFATGRRAPEHPDTRWRYTFEPIAAGCRVTETCEIVKEPGAVGRLLTKLAVGVGWSERRDDLVSGMETTLQRLAAAVEDDPIAP